MSVKQFTSAVFASMVLAISGIAQAGFLGTQMNVGYFTPNTSSPYPQAVFTPSNFTIGAGQETVGDIEGVTNLLIDFTDNTLSVTFDTILASPTWLTADFNGVIFTATSPLDIESLLVVSTTMSGFDNSRVSFTDNQILLNWQGLSYVDGTTVNINFTSASAVPVPGTLALLGLGLVSLALRRRK